MFGKNKMLCHLTMEFKNVRTNDPACMVSEDEAKKLTV